MSVSSSLPEIDNMPSPWFNPSDEDLLTSFLTPKTLDHDTQSIYIGELRFCQYEPSDLPDLCIRKSNSVWHFFCPLEFKHPGRGMRKRKTRAGFWKPTGKPKPVYAKDTNMAIGSRRTLAFYLGTFKENVKTEWYAYEYELIPDPISTVKGHFVLCKVGVRDKKETSKRQPRTSQKTCKGRVSERVPSSSPSNFEGESSNSITNNTAQMMNESPCVESEVTDPATFVSENQVTSELSANSACIEIIPGQVLDSGYENLHLEPMVVSSVRGDAEPTHQMDSDFGNQNSDSTTNYHTCDYDSPMLLLDFEAFNFQSPYVFENISLSPVMEMDSDPSNVSSDCYNGETCGLRTSDFGNQNQDNDVLGILDFGNQNQDDENINMSAFNEGECNSLMGRPLSSCDKGEARSIIVASDLGNHKRCSNIDISGFFVKTSSELASDFGDQNNGKNFMQGDYTLCKLKKKSDEKVCEGAPDDHQMALFSNSKGEPSDCMTYDYQYTTGMAADSTCNAGEPSHLAFDSENQSSSPSTTNSASDENKPNHPTDFDLGGQDSTEMVVSSACNDGEPYYNLLLASENHDPENQISLSDFETNIPVFISGSPYDKGEPCSPKVFDFGNQNQDNNYDISCCIEGDQISPAAGTPPNKENDTSILDKNSSSFWNSLLVDDLEPAWLSKVCPELVTNI